MSEQKDLERAAFEDFIIPSWSLEKRTDSDGDTVYVEDWVQGAWIGWQKARASLPVGVPDGYMPIPTAEQIADALDGVRCYHDMSAELIAPELLANLLGAPTVKAEQAEPTYESIYRAALSAVEEVEVVEFYWPEYHHQGMGCGLEDRGITDRYEAMQYGWDCAIDRCAEIVPDEPLMTVAQHERIVAALSAQQSAHVSVPREWLDAVKELFDAKQAKEDFERENPGNSTKRWDACLYRIEAAEDALRALLNGGEA